MNILVLSSVIFNGDSTQLDCPSLYRWEVCFCKDGFDRSSTKLASDGFDRSSTKLASDGFDRSSTKLASDGFDRSSTKLASDGFDRSSTKLPVMALTGVVRNWPVMVRPA